MQDGKPYTRLKVSTCPLIIYLACSAVGFMDIGKTHTNLPRTLVFCFSLTLDLLSAGISTTTSVLLTHIEMTARCTY